MREYVPKIHQRQQLRLGRSIEKRIAFHLYTFFLSDCLLLLDFSPVPGSLTFLILYLPFSRKTNLSLLFYIFFFYATFFPALDTTLQNRFFFELVETKIDQINETKLMKKPLFHFIASFLTKL